MNRDISDLLFEPCSVFHVPEVAGYHIRRIAGCGNTQDAADIARAMSKATGCTHISTDETGKPTVWEPGTN